VLVQPATGRRRRHCSSACKQKTWREEQKAREFLQPPAELLERWNDAVEALTKFSQADQLDPDWLLLLLADVIDPLGRAARLQEAA
jgi:hypothetical protein